MAKKQKTRNKVLEFLNSYNAICIALAIISISLIIYNRHISKKISVYNFGGAGDEFIILDGTIYTGLDINRFSAPSIIYLGEDKIIKDYKIGYYISDGEISVVEGDEEVDLYSLIRNSDFTFTETSKDAYAFSKDNIDNLDKLHFKIDGILNDKDKIEIDIPLDINKISK